MPTRLRTVVNALVCIVYSAWATSALAQISIPDDPDPLFRNLKIPAKAAEKGMWSSPAAWSIIGLHAALMPSGTVLTYGSQPGDPALTARTFDIWDPAKGLSSAAHTLLPDPQSIDSFCSAATMMVGGNMLISGGNSSKSSTIFDPSRQIPTAVASQMSAPRWYGSMITLADGRSLMAGGGQAGSGNAWKDVAGALQRNDISMTPEVYTAGSGWRTLSGATSRDAFGPDFNRWWYPRMWVAPSGNVFGISSERTWTLDPTGYGAVVSAPFKGPADPNTRPNIGPTSTAVMFDVGQILQVGGNGYSNGYGSPSSSAATVLDIRNSSGKVQVKDTDPMMNARQWANATVLPNGLVVVTGGSRFDDNAGTDAVYDAEIWNPTTGKWSSAAAAAKYRGYHSAATLLQNGTILSTGGGYPGQINNFNAEIFYPPYFFKKAGGKSVLAKRPVLSTINTNAFSYGSSVVLRLAANDFIASISLIGLSNTTHGFNAGQRFQKLSFSQNGINITARMPTSSGNAPPGYYQIVVVNSSGVPSRGVIVSIKAAAPKPVRSGAVSQADGN